MNMSYKIFKKRLLVQAPASPADLFHLSSHLLLQDSSLILVLIFQGLKCSCRTTHEAFRPISRCCHTDLNRRAAEDVPLTGTEDQEKSKIGSLHESLKAAEPRADPRGDAGAFTDGPNTPEKLTAPLQTASHLQPVSTTVEDLWLKSTLMS